MAVTITAGGSFEDSRGQTYGFDIGMGDDEMPGTFYKFSKSGHWMSYEEFWKQAKWVQDQAQRRIREESAAVALPTSPRPPVYAQDETEQWTIAKQQKQVAQGVVASATSSLTDSIPRPMTAQATPTPVSRYKMKKHKGRFTIGI